MNKNCEVCYLFLKLYKLINEQILEINTTLVSSQICKANYITSNFREENYVDDMSSCGMEPEIKEARVALSQIEVFSYHFPLGFTINNFHNESHSII